jgi:membrane associated rhomboid family serine protease
LKRATAIFRTVTEAAQISCVFIGIIFIVFLLNGFVQGRLNAFGIHPRSVAGLVGIVASPFLHANTAHLTTNCSALLVLLFVLFLNPKYQAERTLLLIWFGSGFGTWLIGRGGGTVHIGASSIIYGLIVYLVAAGVWMKGWKPVVAAIVVLVLYAGAIFGLYPQDPKISWEGHLAGALTGWLVARQQHA